MLPPYSIRATLEAVAGSPSLLPAARSIRRLLLAPLGGSFLFLVPAAAMPGHRPCSSAACHRHSLGSLTHLPSTAFPPLQNALALRVMTSKRIYTRTQPWRLFWEKIWLFYHLVALDQDCSHVLEQFFLAGLERLDGQTSQHQHTRQNLLQEHCVQQDVCFDPVCIRVQHRFACDCHDEENGNLCQASVSSGLIAVGTKAPCMQHVVL